MIEFITDNELDVLRATYDWRGSIADNFVKDLFRAAYDRNRLERELERFLLREDLIKNGD